MDFYANILSGSPKVQNKPAVTRGRILLLDWLPIAKPQSLLALLAERRGATKSNQNKNSSEMATRAAILA